MVLEAIRFSQQTASQTASLYILDQLRLPHKTSWLSISGSQAAFDAIQSMQVRGAPAIALVAALSLVVEDPVNEIINTSGNTEPSPADVVDWYCARLDHLVASRPTAVNLADAATKLKHTVAYASQTSTSSSNAVVDAYRTAAERMLRADVRDNEAIGSNGSIWLQDRLGINSSKEASCTVLTHCNTGSLATAGYGTALGIVRSLHSAGLLRKVYYTETRPYNQGSRLTGYELLHDKIPATLVTDSMVGALFRLKGRDENIAAVIVGADRVAANGDTANKIGTYGLAILAREHGVKFLVAAPRTTIDMNTKSGEDILIEERPQEEVLVAKGPRVLDFADSMQTIEDGSDTRISTAALGTEAWNPAFDITPASLIDAIITEVGVAEKLNGSFGLSTLFNQKDGPSAQ